MKKNAPTQRGGYRSRLPSLPSAKACRMMSGMANPDSIALAAGAETHGLDAILVGGNAVNLHSYSRTTFDVDLLVRESDCDRWLSYFRSHGYEPVHQSANFVRLHFVAAPSEALPVDLMLADASTFAAIEKSSRRCDVGNGQSLAVPSPLHLIAMKLHALRSPARFENGIDLQDVKHLIKTAGIDVSSREFTEVAERYATDKIRTRILRELNEESSS